MQNESRLISVVFPVFNEEGNLEKLYEEVRSVCIQHGINYEMVFVDNGSSDNSLVILKDLNKRDNKVRYISLSRNFGHQGALFAGMTYANGDAVITMDADLQHPPSLIPEMLKFWSEGAEVVYTIKKDPNLKGQRRLFVKGFYWLISKISGLNLNFGQSDFRLLDKKALEALLKIPEYHKFLRGQVEWVGFKQKYLFYNVDGRYSGQSKFSYKDLLSFALDGIFAFSRNPLRLITLAGVIISALSFSYILFVMVLWLLQRFGIAMNIVLLPGWATLVVAVFFLSSLQLAAMGILGEYIGRVYDQVKGRPVFIVREISGERHN
ncbi:MAG: glycosyltransferase family 2 protein [Candidatus Omnitrophica bacterium]|nr:glycosyltransferase family 2 protein [Candidatus Omnitrophota bacterium]